MKNSRRLSFFIDLIAALFIFLFLYTAINKFKGLHAFRLVLSKSPLLHPFATILAPLVPGIEVMITALLFFPRTKKAGLVASFGLMSLFTIYIGYMLLFSVKLPCSCGGVLKQMTWRQHFLFNLFFVALALLGLYLHRHYKKLLQYPGPVSAGGPGRKS